MARDAKLMRGDGPVVFAQVKHGVGVEDIFLLIEKAYKQSVDAAASHDTTSSHHDMKSHLQQLK